VKHLVNAVLVPGAHGETIPGGALEGIRVRVMKVFVSSVIKGFETYRAAAREAISLVGSEPIMAEDFPAQSRSSEDACLDGVGRSELYLLILGPRYGPQTRSGLSATEEEYNEACRLRLPVVHFRTTEPMDADQDRFLNRVSGSWSDGNLYRRVDSEQQLKNEIIRSLSDMNRMGSRRTQPPPQQALDDLLKSVDPRYEEVVLTVAWVPDGGETSLLGLNEIDSVLGRALMPAKELLGFRPSVETFAKEQSVEMQQGDDGRDRFLYVELHDDGRLVCGVGLRNDHRSQVDLAAHYVIDSGQVERTVTAFLRLTAGIINTIDSSNSIRQGWLQCRLKGVRQRLVGRMPAAQQSSFTVPMHDLRDPLEFPSAPIRVVVRDLIEPGSLSAGLVGALERRFAEALRGR